MPAFISPGHIGYIDDIYPKSLVCFMKKIRLMYLTTQRFYKLSMCLASIWQQVMLTSYLLVIIRKEVEKVRTLTNNVESFKHIIMEQQKYLESMKRKEISSNIIVSGIPNEPLVVNDAVGNDDGKKVEMIFNHVNCNEKLNGEHKIINFPIREGSTTHSIKIQLANGKRAEEFYCSKSLC